MGWFFAGIAYCGFLSILSFNDGIYGWGIGLVILSVILMLEPLYRYNLMPPKFRKWYESFSFVKFYSRHSGLEAQSASFSLFEYMETLLFVVIMIYYLVSKRFAHLLYSRPIPSFFILIFIIVVFRFCLKIIIACCLTCLYFIRKEKWFGKVLRTSANILFSFMRTIQLVPYFVPDTSKTLYFLNFVCQLIVLCSAILAATQMPNGSLLGPFSLFFMIAAFSGVNILFSRSSGERAAYETELLNARDTQKGLMPSGDPVIENYDISGMSLPATEVGGDYYDYIWLDEKQSKLGIAIADVSGKAMKAAMTAVMTSGMIYQETENSQSPKIILQKINRPMYLKTQKQMFTALSFAVIDLPSRSFTLSNAGQMHPMLRRGTEVRFLKVPGVRLPLGIMEEVHYSELEEQLNQGDIVFFYTDGIPEAMNKEKELFGFERMEQFVRTLSVDSTAKDITTQLFTAVQQHVGDAPQHDDMTVVVVKVQ